MTNSRFQTCSRLSLASVLGIRAISHKPHKTEKLLAVGRMALGTWQGIYLFEHRDAPHQRQVVAHLG
mgnify:CR=1 FL=1